MREWPHPRDVTTADLRSFQQAAPRARFGLVAASVAPSRLGTTTTKTSGREVSHVAASDVMDLTERLMEEWSDVEWKTN